MEQSARFTLNKEDLRKWGKGFCIALVGAGFTYLEQQVVPHLNFGEYTAVAAAINSAIVHLVSKWLAHEGELF